jgi:hypothetical protein
MIDWICCFWWILRRGNHLRCQLAALLCSDESQVDVRSLKRPERLVVTRCFVNSQTADEAEDPEKGAPSSFGEIPVRGECCSVDPCSCLVERHLAALHAVCYMKCQDFVLDWLERPVATLVGVVASGEQEALTD